MACVAGYPSSKRSTLGWNSRNNSASAGPRLSRLPGSRLFERIVTSFHHSNRNRNTEAARSNKVVRSSTYNHLSRELSLAEEEWWAARVWVSGSTLLATGECTAGRHREGTACTWSLVLPMVYTDAVASLCEKTFQVSRYYEEITRR